MSPLGHLSPMSPLSPCSKIPTREGPCLGDRYPNLLRPLDKALAIATVGRDLVYDATA